jgi:hypothetical protein
MSRIVSFRGLLASGAETTLTLHTNDGLTGYRIVKLEAMPYEPSGASGTNVIKIFSIPPGAATATIDFEDNTLLASAVIAHNASAFQYPPETSVVFDNIKFNQDIFITQIDADGNATACNYHIELEQVRLDLNESTVATLKNIRNND